MAVKNTYEGPKAALQAYERLVGLLPAAARKGATMPYTSRNGHMFSFLDPHGVMALRLASEARAEFVARFGAAEVQQRGAVMKEYVTVPAALLADSAQLLPWLEGSFEWVGTLTPKATTRAKKPSTE